MFLSPSYKTIELLPIVESLFDLGQKDIRRRSKALWLYSLTIKVWQLPLYDTFRTRLIYKCQLFTFIDTYNRIFNTQSIYFRTRQN